MVFLISSNPQESELNWGGGGWCLINFISSKWNCQGDFHMSPRQQAWSLTNSSPPAMLTHSVLNGWAKAQRPWLGISHRNTASVTRKWAVSFQRNGVCSCGIWHVHNWHDYLHIKGHVFLFIGCRKISLSSWITAVGVSTLPCPCHLGVLYNWEA